MMKTPWISRAIAAALFAAPVAFFGARHWRGDDRSFLPGPTSGGHHQIESRCSECHVPLGGVSQDACLRCHGESLRSREDSHAAAKFDDPGKASQLALVDARACLTCHREHRTEARVRGSVTIATTFCSTCHASVGTERPSHAGFAADGCLAAGCHNYHDNRSLYHDLLARHRGDEDLLSDGRLPAAPPSTAAAPPPDLPIDDDPRLATARDQWAASAHGRGAVGCQACHGSPGAPTDPRTRWRVADTTCASCHASERAGFLAGKHGMRLAVGLTAMSPSLALAPEKMKSDAADRSLGCTSCHGAHRFDRVEAAVSACEGCHDDTHTRNYRGSPHFATWQRETQQGAPPGSGVSCASCHLPRQKGREHGADVVRVVHNQNGNLRPSDRMARDVCLACHGLGFSLAALADPALVERNFRGSPGPITTGMQLVLKEKTNDEKAK